MKTIASTDMKQINRKVVFDIAREKRTVTRVELSEMTGMSGPSILAIVNEFLEKGILSITGKKEGAVGRSPVTMVFNPNVLLSVGIEFEGNNLSAGLVNLDGEICFQTMVKVPSNLGESFFDALYRSIDKLTDMAKEKGLKYSGIGFGIPGAVDPMKRLIHFAPYVGVMDPMDISAEIAALEERYHVPVYIENDVNARASGEYYLRKMQKEFQDLLYISLGAGIGAGLILDGKLRRGGRGLCGEIGYSLRDAKETVSRKQMGWLEQSLSPGNLGSRFEAYGKHGKVDAEMAGYVAEILSPFIANLVNTLDINLVVMGGQLMLDGGDLIQNVIRDEVQKLSLSEKEIQSSATEYMGVIGSALMASDRLWETIL